MGVLFELELLDDAGLRFGSAQLSRLWTVAVKDILPAFHGFWIQKSALRPTPETSICPPR